MLFILQQKIILRLSLRTTVHETCQKYFNLLILTGKAFSKNIIMLLRPYNLDPITSPFYVVKLGFTGLYIIFLIFGSNAYPQSMF